MVIERVQRNVEDMQVSIPLSAIIALIERLEPADMYALYEWLDAKLLSLEDELMETAPDLQAELRKAYAEYEAGNYITLDELRQELADKGK
jgi:hypothetical protein